MIVRDAGSSWQVVLQTDHADLSADIARRWTGLDKAKDSVVIATQRHDDGWAVWEQAPAFDPDTGRPVNFLDVDILSHLAFYRACIAAVTEQDPYAGLLVSMHGAGIYRQRYGSDPNLKLTREPEALAAIDAFVADQEAGYGSRIEALGLDEEERWENYNHLQMFDRLSLYFCMRDVEGGEAATIGDYGIEPALAVGSHDRALSLRHRSCALHARSTNGSEEPVKRPRCCAGLFRDRAEDRRHRHSAPLTRRLIPHRRWGYRSHSGWTHPAELPVAQHVSRRVIHETRQARQPGRRPHRSGRHGHVRRLHGRGKR